MQLLKFPNFLFCSVLFCSVLFCSVLFCSVLFCSVRCHWLTKIIPGNLKISVEDIQISKEICNDVFHIYKVISKNSNLIDTPRNCFNGLKSRLDMRDNRKCITISLSTLEPLFHNPVPLSNSNSYNDRSFVVTAPKLWNSIPIHYVRNAETLNNFKSMLKTYLLKSSRTFTNLPSATGRFNH